MAAGLVEAAGGVLWRPAIGGSGVEVALVHRPKYDDWSVPKGKLNPAEHPVVGAIREVWEETGYRATPGRPLGEVHYVKDEAPKRVRYWTLRADEGRFIPSAEVDQLMWLPPREAQQHLPPDRDRRIVAEFASDPDPTWPCLLVRHGTAGERSTWRGDDRDRPLDELGHAQAKALVAVFDAYRVRRLLSADVLRCLDTVGPFAAARRIPVESEPLLSETGYATNPRAAIERVAGIVATGEPVVMCSQGKAMPDLIARMSLAYDASVPADTATPKGGYWVAHFARNGKLRLAGLERFDPLA